VKTAFRIAWILLCLGLALTARCWNLRDVFVEERIYFLDPDCYARMTRAQLILEHPWTIVRHHDFENWPEGIKPHTTAPFDYLIVGLKGMLDLGFKVVDPQRTSLLHDQTLDLAGAIISPLLGVAGTLFLALWLWRFPVRYGGMALLLSAVCPILVHGTLLGRPDHQSLLIFLLTIAGGCELAIAAPATEGVATINKRKWALAAGIAWALALWVSLYEPLILLVIVSILWLIADRRAWWSVDRRAGAITGLAIVVIFIAVEGLRVTVPGASDHAAFSRWIETIAEMRHLDPRSTLLYSWLGWTVLAAPVLLFLARKTDRRVLPMLAMFAAVLALTIWQLRWGYFLALVFIYALPWQMQAMRRGWVAWFVFIASLWPLLKDWDARLYPNEFAQDRMAMQRAEGPALRSLVMATTNDDVGPILAPWWLSPSIAYWTHNSCVAGSSHQSLPGILDTARFYLSDSPEAAAAILRARGVRWVLADEPARVIKNSTTLLATTPPADPLARFLMNPPVGVPEYLDEWTGAAAIRPDGLRFYRLYRVNDAALP
jgi:hypothetical protein